MWPLYAAGFTTAFGAHAVAANLGESPTSGHLADGPRRPAGPLRRRRGLLKPVFGTLTDRIGARPVLLDGLIAFALASAIYVLADSPGWLWAARLGQGAAASAFSPAASALVARLNPAAKHGGFGSYGFYKSIGYTLGPLLGGLLVWVGGLRLLFGGAHRARARRRRVGSLAVPVAPPLPKTRQTVLDLARRIADPVFLAPTAALAAATAALSVGVGFLPVLGRAAGLGTIATGAAVSVLALCGALVQPRAGAGPGRRAAQRRDRAGRGSRGQRRRTSRRRRCRPGGRAGRGGADRRGHRADHAAGFRRAGRQHPEGTPRPDQAAELGRELGDAGGPLLVVGVATYASLGLGFGVLRSCWPPGLPSH